MKATLTLKKNLHLKGLAMGLAAAMAFGLGSADALAKDINSRIIRFGYGLADTSPTGRPRDSLPKKSPS